MLYARAVDYDKAYLLVLALFDKIALRSIIDYSVTANI